MAEPNRLFVSVALLDHWVEHGYVELLGDAIRLPRAAASFVIEEAVRVVGEVSGGGDLHELTNRVRSVRELRALGAEIVDRAMVMTDLAYDVVPGFLISVTGAPVSTAETAALFWSEGESVRDPEAPRSDEELLARYLMEKLER